MRKGRERLWEVDAGPLRVAQDWLRTISRDLDGSLVRLKEYVGD
jgi:hypothetical protein